MKKYTVLIALTGLLSLNASAIQSFEHATKTKNANQWEVVDIRFTASKLPEKPVDAEISCTFTPAEGKPLKISAFYDGNSEYVARFCPPSTGTWRYTLSAPGMDLDGQAGDLNIGEALDGRKGGITVNPDAKREFVYANGDSYYPIAFEVDWLFALDADNADDIPLTRLFVNRVAKEGYNQIVMNVFANDVNWKKDDKLAAHPEHEYGSPQTYPFLGNNTEPDHSNLNIDYFKRLERVINYLDQKGMASHLMVYVWNKGVNWPKADSEEDNRYFDYVMKRYQAFPNIIWDVSKEALGYGHDDVGYITRRIEHIQDLDAHDRMITVHDYGYCAKHPEYLDFISVQIWRAELYSQMVRIREEFKDQPVLNIEHGGYERSPYVVFPGSYDRPDVCLERAWQCVFAGTYPSHYWQGAAWNVLIADIDSLPTEEQPKLEYYRHMSEFIKQYNVGKLKSGEARSNSGLCLHNDKDLFIYYVPKECRAIGPRIPKELRGRMMSSTWFDPHTGEYSKTKRQKVTQWPSYAKPDTPYFQILVVQVEEMKE